MAKMFYTMEEAKAALGRSEDEIKVLSRDGKLREFRDGPRLMFKADQVEALKTSLPPKDTIDIADSGAPISLADSKSGSMAGGSNAGSVSIKDDTSSGEIGLSGSFGGVPSPRSMNQGSRSGSGVNIFNPDEVESADPSAATAITNSSESGNMEAVGSGSGLLDLTRESDDTSLGAVLDEISPGKRDPNASKMGTGVAPAIPAAAPMGRQQPMAIAKPDKLEGLFGGFALGGAVLSLFALFVLASAVNGASISFLKSIVDLGFLMIVLGGLVLALIFGGIGFGLGKVLK